VLKELPAMHRHAPCPLLEHPRCELESRSHAAMTSRTNTLQVYVNDATHALPHDVGLLGLFDEQALESQASQGG
jgi:hypothetical protein